METQGERGIAWRSPLIDLRAVEEAVVAARHLLEVGRRKTANFCFAAGQLTGRRWTRRRADVGSSVLPQLTNRGVRVGGSPRLENVVAGSHRAWATARRRAAACVEAGLSGGTSIASRRCAIAAGAGDTDLTGSAISRWVAASHGRRHRARDEQPLRFHPYHLTAGDVRALGGDVATVEVGQVIVAIPSVPLRADPCCVIGVSKSSALANAIDAGGRVNDRPEEILAALSRVPQDAMERSFALDALTRTPCRAHWELGNDWNVGEVAGDARPFTSDRQLGEDVALVVEAHVLDARVVDVRRRRRAGWLRRKWAGRRRIKNVRHWHRHRGVRIAVVEQPERIGGRRELGGGEGKAVVAGRIPVDEGWHLEEAAPAASKAVGPDVRSNAQIGRWESGWVDGTGGEFSLLRRIGIARSGNECERRSPITLVHGFSPPPSPRFISLHLLKSGIAAAGFRCTAAARGDRRAFPGTAGCALLDRPYGPRDSRAASIRSRPAPVQRADAHPLRPSRPLGAGACPPPGFCECPSSGLAWRC